MQDRPTIDNQKVSRFQCENCGADMGFDAAAGGLHCQYCGHVQAVSFTGTVEERSYEEFISAGTRSLTPMAVEAMQVQCSSCGAVVNFTPPETAAVCAFCGNRIVAQPKAADPILAPNGVLPFLVTQRDAVVHFNRWLGSLWFAPSKLKHLADADKLVSIYIPYWTYDAATGSDYTGQRGENYQVTESYVQNGQTKYRTVTKIRW
nr:primosomal protein N' (replication factor Y) - superfamily II helicase [Blastocatellia bacterium]